MARNSDRQFSESESLNAKDMGAYIPEAEERLPAWAQDRETAKEREKAADNGKGSNPLPQEDRAGEEASASRLVSDAPAGEEEKQPEELPEDEEEEDAEASRQEADRAWSREATRVEGGAYRRRGTPEPSGEPAPKTGGKKNRKKPGKGKKKKNTTQAEDRRSFMRNLAIAVICGVLFLMVALMVISNFVSYPILSVPKQIVNTAFSPVQNIFSGMTDSVVKYLRTLKIRGNLEYEYEQLLIKNDDMANDTAMMEELRRENQALRDQLQEQKNNPDMNGLFAQVIGKVGNNYFSTLTLNVGSADGVSDYMAVVSQGGLVGVTYGTQRHTCEVRCIIDSDCTVAGVVQSSRDQGSVKGTLGTNGEPMCRMYYLPDNSLPRPNDVVVTSGVGLEFPKGIPIGYIRESTRGMEDNKSYVVLEPVVDFQHLEYVTVYRYRPNYAEDAQSRISTSNNLNLVELTTARPVPTFQVAGLSDFIYSATQAPEGMDTESTPEPTAEISVTAAPERTPDPNETPMPPNLEYHPQELNGATPTPSPRPTFTPTPSPAPTPDAGAMTVEDDDE